MGVYLWHFKVAGFCGLEAMKHDHHVDVKDVRRTCFRQTASVTTLVFAGAPNASTDTLDQKDHLQATIVCLKERKSLTKNVI